MTAAKNKPLMRNIGEFFGHILKGIKTDPAKPPGRKQVISKEVQEQENENMILRRTTIDEVEFKNHPNPDQTPDHDTDR